jgi:transposase-like protein/IS1 family transposase
MIRTRVSGICCPNPDCAGQTRSRITRHGFFRLKNGSRRRRYRCNSCGKSFCTNNGTPYYQLHCSRRDFDEVAAMSVEGVSISAIARIRGISWNTVARWLRRAAEASRTFNDIMTKDYVLKEIQADEIQTFVNGKKDTMWILMAIEVWSRLWPSTVLGRRSYRNIKRLMEDTSRRGRFERIPLITTDGFFYYGIVIGRLFKQACVYGQVIKTMRKNRVTKVERRLLIGSKYQLEDALFQSEDSEKLNTAFIERLNLTVRQGSAYLGRRSACHARSAEHLENHLELLRCHYNFIRQHRALKFGKEMKTPAMQAGLVSSQLSFREIFMSVGGMLLYVLIVIDLGSVESRMKAA